MWFIMHGRAHNWAEGQLFFNFQKNLWKKAKLVFFFWRSKGLITKKHKICSIFTCSFTTCRKTAWKFRGHEYYHNTKSNEGSIHLSTENNQGIGNKMLMKDLRSRQHKISIKSRNLLLIWKFVCRMKGFKSKSNKNYCLPRSSNESFSAFASSEVRPQGCTQSTFRLNLQLGLSFLRWTTYQTHPSSTSHVPVLLAIIKIWSLKF